MFYKFYEFCVWNWSEAWVWEEGTWNLAEKISTLEKKWALT